jgi:flagellar L-ring protein precursor FlgH
MSLPRALLLAGLLAPLALPQAAQAEQLYEEGSWSAMATDRKAGAIGDIVTVVIYQAARASSRLENNSSRNSEIGGGLQAGGIDESATLEFGGSYAGRGEAVRTEQFVTQMSASVIEILPNGDFVIEGTQHMLINGEETAIGVRGRIRPQDISAENAVLSSRLADAKINYDGKGFVSRSAKPGLLNRIFSFLGIG